MTEHIDPTSPYGQPGHGPADPPGYLIERGGDGWQWTRRADDHTESGYDSRTEAVGAAEANRQASEP
jgi:hypothetical protein